MSVKNKAASPNAAFTLWFHLEHLKRGVGAPVRLVPKKMKPRTAQKAALFAILSISLSLSAADWASKEAGVSFRLPSDQAWRQVTPPRQEAKLIIQATNGPATVFFASFDRKHEENEMTEKVAEAFERSYFRKSSTKKVSGEFFDFKGKHAYKIVDEQNVDGHIDRSVAIVWLTDGKLSNIVVSKFDGDPMRDAVIRVFVGSTTFLANGKP